MLKLHYLRWVLFDINGETYFMYQGIFDTDFDKYTEDAVALFTQTGIDTVFENLEGFPEDWKTNPPAFVKFVREHHCPSFLEYGEYPYVQRRRDQEGPQAEGGVLRTCSTRCSERAGQSLMLELDDIQHFLLARPRPRRAVRVPHLPAAGGRPGLALRHSRQGAVRGRWRPAPRTAAG